MPTLREPLDALTRLDLREAREWVLARASAREARVREITGDAIGTCDG